MSLQGIRKDLQTLKKDIANGYKSIEELSKSDINFLSDYELYRLIRHETPSLMSEPELNETEFNKLSDEEILKIIKIEDT